MGNDDKQGCVIGMWVFYGGDTNTGSPAGFLSAVQFEDNADTLSVRARDAESLTSLAAFADVDVIPDWPGSTDYPFRVFVPRDVFGVWLMSAVDDISYTNFKSHVHKTRGWAWSDALMRVWTAMLGVEPVRVRG